MNALLERVQMGLIFFLLPQVLISSFCSLEIKTQLCSSYGLDRGWQTIINGPNQTQRMFCMAHELRMVL